MIENIKVRIYKDPLTDMVKIGVFAKNGDGKRLIAKNIDLVFEPIGECEVVKPTIELSNEFAYDFLQALTDALNNEGYVPKEKSFLEGKIEATEKHLEDMRKLVFKNEK
jgi:hypothetical protein